MPVAYNATYDYALDSTASLLCMDRTWLKNVILLESSWNPAAYNKSGAVGLIQFMPATLKDFKIISPALAAKIPSGPSPIVPEDVKQAVRNEFMAKYPDTVSQLFGPVTTYFKRYRTYPTEQSVYLTVLYPAYRNASLDTAFNATVQRANPGIKTVGDYVALVQSKAKTKDIIAKATKPLSLLALGGAALLGYFSLKA